MSRCLVTPDDIPTFETKHARVGTSVVPTHMETPAKDIIIVLDSTTNVTKLIDDDMDHLTGEDHTPSSLVSPSSPVLNDSNVQRELFPIYK